MAVIATLATRSSWGGAQPSAAAARIADDFAAVPPDNRWNRSIRLECRDGDNAPWNGLPGQMDAEVAQVQSWSSQQANTVRWTEFWIRYTALAPNWGPTTWHFSMEWHTRASNTQAPWALQVNGNRQYLRRSNGVSQWGVIDTLAGASDFGVWHHYRVGVRSAADTSGWWEMWRDNVRVLLVTGVRTAVVGNESWYPKIGFYRPIQVNGTSLCHIAGFVVHDANPGYPGSTAPPPPPPPPPAEPAPEDTSRFGAAGGGTVMEDAKSDEQRGSTFPLASAQLIPRVKCWMDGFGVGSGAQVHRALVYRDSDDALLGTSAEVSVPDGSAAAWRAFEFSPALSLPAASYRLALHSGGVYQASRYGVRATLPTFIGPVAGTGHAEYMADVYTGGAATPFVPGVRTDEDLGIYAVTTAPGATPAEDASRFGAADSGTVLQGAQAESQRGSSWPLGTTRRVATVKVWMDGLGGAAGSQVHKALIYAQGGALIATSNEVTVAAGAAASWVPFTFASPPVLARGSWRLHMTSGGTSNVSRYGLLDAGGLEWNFEAYADGAQTPWVPQATTFVTALAAYAVTSDAPVAPLEAYTVGAPGESVASIDPSGAVVASVIAVTEITDQARLMIEQLRSVEDRALVYIPPAFYERLAGGVRGVEVIEVSPGVFVIKN